MPDEGVRKHLMATGEYHATGSTWTGRSGKKSGAAVVASGVAKGAKFILKTKKKS